MYQERNQTGMPHPPNLSNLRASDIAAEEGRRKTGHGTRHYIGGRSLRRCGNFLPDEKATFRRQCRTTTTKARSGRDERPGDKRWPALLLSVPGVSRRALALFGRHLLWPPVSMRRPLPRPRGAHYRAHFESVGGTKATRPLFGRKRGPVIRLVWRGGTLRRARRVAGLRRRRLETKCGIMSR